jgi:hypothetical protein
MKPDVDVAALTRLKIKDQIVDALAASFVFVHKAVDTLTPDNAFQSVRVPIPGMTRLTLASFIAAHASNEYGQMVEYLRTNGIVPPGTQKEQSIAVRAGAQRQKWFQVTHQTARFPTGMHGQSMAHSVVVMPLSCSP